MPGSETPPVGTGKPSSFFAGFQLSRFLILAAGLLLLILTHPVLWTTKITVLWFPTIGLGLALTAWFGWRGILVTSLAVFLVRLVRPETDLLAIPFWADAGIIAAELFAAWGIFHQVGQGHRRINDPRSATGYLLVVPGAVAGCAAMLRAFFCPAPYWHAVSFFWITDAISLLSLAPLLLIFLTPWLERARWIARTSPPEFSWVDPGEEMTRGDIVEMLGLSLGAAILGILLTRAHFSPEGVNWQFWAILLLVVVWASLRQGLRGGSVAATVAAGAALFVAGVSRPDLPPFVALQGNLLALCSTALLVGASSGWLRASELRYRQVVGQIPVVLYSARIISPASRGKPLQAQILLVSAACQKIFGCSTMDLQGDYSTWLDRVHPDDRELVLAALAQLSRQSGPVHCEYRLNPAYFLSDGDTPGPKNARTPLPNIPAVSDLRSPAKERWVRDTLAPNFAKDGRLQGWEGVVEDITTQRSLALDLQRASTMLHTLVASLPAGVFFVQGPMGQPTLVNTRARQLLGQREDPSAGLPHVPRVYRLHKPDGSLYPYMELPVYKALHEGIPSMKDDIVVHRSDGRRVPLIAWGAPIDLGKGGNIDAAVWVFEDRTALQQAEAARLESEERLRAIIETMAEGLIIQNQDGKIIECNPAACSLLGVAKEKLLGQSFLVSEPGFLQEDGSPFPRDQHPDQLALQTRQPVRNVVMGIPNAQGPEQSPPIHWLLVNCIPLNTGQKGRPGFSMRVITTLADITTSRRMVSDMERVQRLETAARLASGFVHDFNNLLTVILALAQMAQMKLMPEHPLVPDLETIQSAAEEAARLAAQLLTFSKQKKNQLALVDLNEVVQKTLQILESTLPGTISVEMKLASSPAWVLAEDSQLQQILMNLCLNARDAMPDGGTLSVQITLEPEPFSRPGATVFPSPEQLPSDRKFWARLSIQDTGHGMDKTTQSKIFDPFFSTKERGTGLGLAVVRQLVESFHGQITVWSEPEKGTCFDVWLPLHFK